MKKKVKSKKKKDYPTQLTRSTIFMDEVWVVIPKDMTSVNIIRGIEQYKIILP